MIPPHPITGEAKKKKRERARKAVRRQTAVQHLTIIMQAASNHSNIDNAIMTRVHFFPPTHDGLAHATFSC